MRSHRFTKPYNWKNYKFGIVALVGILSIFGILVVGLSLIHIFAKASYQDTVCFTDPKTIAQYYMEDLRHEKQEHMKLLMLNSKAKLLGETTISKGTVNASLVTPSCLLYTSRCV